jgi:hypothetical protein
VDPSPKQPNDVHPTQPTYDATPVHRVDHTTSCSSQWTHPTHRPTPPPPARWMLSEFSEPGRIAGCGVKYGWPNLWSMGQPSAHPDVGQPDRAE